MITLTLSHGTLLGIYLFGILGMYIVLIPEVATGKRTLAWYCLAGSFAAVIWPLFLLYAIFCIVLWMARR